MGVFRRPSFNYTIRGLKRFIPSKASSGTQSIEFTCNGGAITGGSNPYQVLRIETNSAGAIASGSISNKFTRSELLSSGSVAGGANNPQVLRVEVNSSGAIVGGSNLILKLKLELTTGGSIAGGTNPYETSGLQGVEISLTGGAVAGSSIPVIKVSSLSLSGGSVAGGSIGYLQFIDFLVSGGSIAGGITPVSNNLLNEVEEVLTGGAVAGGNSLPIVSQVFEISGGSISGGKFTVLKVINRFSFAGQDTVKDWMGTAYLGIGPWDFTVQPNKLHYNESEDIAHYTNSIWKDILNRNLYPPVTPEIHDPWCGYWYREPGLEEPIFIATNNANKGVKRDKVFRQLIPKVTLACPWGICVDDQYVYVWEGSRNLISKRNKSNLAEVDTVYETYGYGVHVDSGDILWSSTTGGLKTFNKHDMTLIKYYEHDDLKKGYVTLAFDITSDEDYLYYIDSGGHRVIKVQKSDLSFVADVGAPEFYGYWVYDITVSGNYIYLASLNQILKIDRTTWEIVREAGRPYGGGYDVTTGSVPDPHGVEISGTRLFVSIYEGLLILNSDNLQYITLIPNGDPAVTGTLWDPWKCVLDNDYIYVCDGNSMVTKWDIDTYAFVSENGDRTGVTTDGENAYSYLTGITADSTYLYVLDQGDDLRVIKRNKSDLSYVGEYRDVGYVIFNSPEEIYVDDTYIYVGDSKGINRINKSTLAYVDKIDLSANVTWVSGIFIVDGTDVYVTDSSSGTQDPCCYKYDLATWTKQDESPDTTDIGEEYQLCVPNGITVDENYLYVAIKDVYSQWYGNMIKIFDKNTLLFVDQFNIPQGYPEPLAVDNKYLYVPVRGTGSYPSQLRKYDKATYDLVRVYNETLVISLDTAYRYQLGYVPSNMEELT